MTRNDAGEIRRSSVVTTFGPGSIIDLKADDGFGGPIAGCAAGLDEWDDNAPLSDLEIVHQIVIEPRLSKKLQKRKFRLAPVISEKNVRSSLVARRFPAWLQCPRCDRIAQATYWNHDTGQASRFCGPCTNKQPGNRRIFVAPVRFITACELGHLDDFPWHAWVKHLKTCERPESLVLKSVAPGLAGLFVSCPRCSASRSMDSAFSKNALSGLKCRGKRPWLRSDDTDCQCSGDAGTFRVVQRGASNLYYPVIESALAIPPWTDRIETAFGDYWDDLTSCDGIDQRVQLLQITKSLTEICERLGMQPVEVAEYVTKRVEDFEEFSVVNLKHDEYRVFIENRSYVHDEFECHPRKPSDLLSSHFNSFSRVSRLKEVQVLRGFTRIKPPIDADQQNLSPISTGELDWLPANELRGEGIFIEFSDAALREWETSQLIEDRVQALKASWQKEFENRGGSGEAPERTSPRFLLIHTFSHLLIAYLTLECGYSSSSLRERIYVDSKNLKMNGLLIYTGTSDSEGTLGGLQNRARMGLLEDSILGAINSQLWCSSDPLCISGSMASPESHSLASCHSCALLPETSCEHYNRFLDRALLIGSEVELELGFFKELINYV